MSCKYEVIKINAGNDKSRLLDYHNNGVVIIISKGGNTAFPKVTTSHCKQKTQKSKQTNI